MDFLKYFPELTEKQIEQYRALQPLYEDWNAKINVISRKDISNFYERHVQHSLAIAKFLEETFNQQKRLTIIDVGCGGGFPGIPLAIKYPQHQFLLVDRIGKKVRVAEEIAKSIGLENVTFRHASVEEVKETFDYAVSRAVMTLPDLLKLVKRVATKGLVCLKGGDLAEELAPAICRGTVVKDISEYFNEEFFETKKVVMTRFSGGKK